jgi:transposase
MKMPTMRSTAELEALSAEAERRVRDGESRAEVALALDVPLSTMTDWARRGRWLRRDLEAEHRPELTRLVAERIAQLRDREEEQRFAAQRRELSLATAATTAATADDEKARLDFADPAGNASP